MLAHILDVDEDLADSCPAVDNLEEPTEPAADPLFPTPNVVADFIDRGPTGASELPMSLQPLAFSKAPLLTPLTREQDALLRLRLAWTADSLTRDRGVRAACEEFAASPPLRLDGLRLKRVDWRSSSDERAARALELPKSPLVSVASKAAPWLRERGRLR